MPLTSDPPGDRSTTRDEPRLRGPFRRWPGRAIASAALGLATLGSLSCADRTPAKIATSALPAVIVDTGLHALDASVVNHAGATLGGQTVAYAAGPEGVAEISANGGLRCLKTGDTTLTLTGGGLSSPVRVKCRLPTEIALPQSLQLVLGSAPTTLRPRALGEGGRPLDDVPVLLASSDPAVVLVDGDKAKPVAVGRATVKASAGGIVTVMPVEVDEKVVSEAVALPDGAARSWTLKEGDYLVTIDVRPAVKVAQGVTVSWAGTNCESQPEQPSHRFGCRVAESATMTVANPKQMGVGAKVSGTVSVFRVPPPP